MIKPFDPAWRSWLQGRTGAVLALCGLLLLLAAALAAVLEPHWRAGAAALDNTRPAPTPDTTAVLQWPAPQAHGGRVDQLLQLAREQGLKVLALREDAQVAPTASAVAWRGVTLHAEGAYARQRAFVAAALATDAALALDSLVLQRNDLGSATLRAEYVFAFGQQAAAAAGAPSAATAGAQR